MSKQAIGKGSLGRTLRQARKALGLSLRALSRMSGMSPAQISQIEAGSAKSPGFVSIARIARALQISLDDLGAIVEVGNDVHEAMSTPEPSILKEIRELRKQQADLYERVIRCEALLEASETA